MCPTALRALARRCAVTLAAAFIACGAAGCTLQKPKVTVTGVTVGAVDFARATLNVRVHVENPNPIPIHASSLSYQIGLGGSQLVSGTVPGGVDVNAAGASDLTFPLTFQYASAIQGLENILAQGSIHYQVTANMGFAARLAAVEVGPLTTEGDLPLPRLPLVRPTNVTVGPPGLGGVSVQVALDVQNPNAFGFDIGSMTSSLTLAGQPLSESQLGPLALAANGTAQTTLTMTLPMSAIVALAQAIQSSSGGSVPYEWKGQMVVQGMTLGVDSKGTIPAPALPSL